MQFDDLVTQQFRLKDSQARALSKLGIKTIEDLLYHFPARYAGEADTVIAKVVSQGTRKGWRRRVPMAEMQLLDTLGRKIKAIWFSQAYMAKMFNEGTFVRLSGKSKEYKGLLSFINPKIERATGELGTGPLFAHTPAPSTQNLVPVYPESRGVSSLWLTYALQKILSSNILEKAEDPIPTSILKKYSLPSLSASFIYIHRPKREGDAKAARKRFSFQEIFFIQLARQKAKKEYGQAGSYKIDGKRAAQEFTDRMSFVPTRAQKKALGAIVTDLAKPNPMMRLLEGDVGSGKTFVAAAAAYAVIQAGLQVAYMAPTEILAKQHFDSFIGMFSHMPDVEIGLLTGSGCRKYPSKIGVIGHPAVGEASTNISRSLMLKHIVAGQMNIVIGTHAHIADSVKWARLALVVIDEQHRFGVGQRATFVHKETKFPFGNLVSKYQPHLLSMTATPIPRTLALTIYGDLDLTLLDESPPGRKPIITKIVPPGERLAIYEHIRREVKSGRQAYVICPRINEPDPKKETALETKDVKTETERLGKEIFPELMVGMIHGKMKASEKDEVMAEFLAGEIHVLVATSVVEVGVNVPNATMIVIEGAERFGLAQLHQLRGRVLRSSHQAYCYLFTTAKAGQASKEGGDIPKRLSIIEKARSGFELAEQDLKLRGPGALGGNKQWGISDVGMEALQNLKMVEAARSEAKLILDSDPDLSGHPLLGSTIESLAPPHFE